MKRIFLLLIAFLISMTFKSQAGKVGIQTPTPTEILDINGTARFRNSPFHQTANAISTLPNGTGSATQNQSFDARQIAVSDANGVLGSYDAGLPVYSVTRTFIAPAGGFATGGTPSNPTYRVPIGDLEVGFYQTTNNNQLYVVFRSNSPGTDIYTADLREFGGTFQDWRVSQTLSSGTWSSPIGYIIIGVDTWLLNINFRKHNKIYRVTVLGARWSGGGSGTTTAGDQFTVNIQELSGWTINL